MSFEGSYHPENKNNFENKTTLKHLFPADFAKTYSTKVFGDDSVGRDLLMRDLLQGLQGEEKQLLKTKLATREAPAPLEIVKVFEGKHIVVNENYEGENPQFILTNELNGCAATILFSENTNTSEREVVFTHFPPFMEERNIKMVDELVTPEMKAGSKKKVLVFCQEKRSEWVSEFVQKILNIYGNDTEIEVVKYKKEGREDDGTLLVRIPKISVGPISVHHSAGDIKI